MESTQLESDRESREFRESSPLLFSDNSFQEQSMGDAVGPMVRLT